MHPAGLEGGVLPVVGKHQQAPALGAVDHALGQHMHIGHRGGAHRAGRLAVVAAKPAATRAARHTARQLARVLGALLHKVQRLQSLVAAAAQAVGQVAVVHCAAVAAGIQRLGTHRVVLGVGAHLVVQRQGAHAAQVDLSAAPDPALALGAAATRLGAGEVEVFQPMLKVVLAAGGAAQQRKAVQVGVHRQRVFG